MNQTELHQLMSETLRSPRPAIDQFEQVAAAVLNVVRSGEPRFFDHVRNRLGQIAKSTGEVLDANTFDLETARRLVADEIGFSSWDDLRAAVETPGDRPPLLFQYAIAAMGRGDFTALEDMIGAEGFRDQIVEWYENGFFDNEQETLDEILSAACMLGQTQAVGYLVDKGVDPYAGMRTWLAGPHYAASSGRLGVIKVLIERGVPLEVENKYGGTVLGQALWSAINEPTGSHADIIERLIEAGAVVEPGTLEWWSDQPVPDRATKARVSDILAKHAEFHARVNAAQQAVTNAESNGSQRAFADALKALGNILRRPPFGRDAANKAYARAADLYHKLGLPLEEAWVKRHIGINHEYAERLTEAEKYYDESLALFRQHASENDDNYANTVRYPAVIKNRVGKRDESAALWAEAVRRYHEMDQPLGVAEGAAWLTIFAIEKGDTALANEWFAKAEAAAAAANDSDTDKWVTEVRARLNALAD